MSHKTKYIDVYKKYKEKGLILLSTIYTNNRIPMNCIDKNGFKYYLGGISPVDDNEAAFVINVIKYDKDLAKQFYPYSARLMYGTYDYVKEEF